MKSENEVINQEKIVAAINCCSEHKDVAKMTDEEFIEHNLHLHNIVAMIFQEEKQ